MSKRNNNGRNKSPPNIETMISLKVDNLSYNTTVDDLKRHFSKYGEVGDIYIPRNPFTMASRGFAFVRYYSEREAEKAIDALNGREIDGRDIRICHARYDRPGSVERRSKYKSPRRRRSRSNSRSRSRSRSPQRSAKRGRNRTKSRSRSRRRSKSGNRRRNRSAKRSKSYTRSRSSRSRSRRTRSRS